MSLSSYSTETISELLRHLADHEVFESTEKIGFHSSEVSDILRSVATDLEKTFKDRVQAEELPLSPKVLGMLSSLSPREEFLLFKSFKLLPR